MPNRSPLTLSGSGLYDERSAAALYVLSGHRLVRQDLYFPFHPVGPLIYYPKVNSFTFSTRLDYSALFGTVRHCSVFSSAVLGGRCAGECLEQSQVTAWVLVETQNS